MQTNSINTLQSPTLRLSLKKKWFEMTKAGIKTEGKTRKYNQAIIFKNFTSRRKAFGIR